MTSPIERLYIMRRKPSAAEFDPAQISIVAAPGSEVLRTVPASSRTATLPGTSASGRRTVLRFRQRLDRPGYDNRLAHSSPQHRYQRHQRRRPPERVVEAAHRRAHRIPHRPDAQLHVLRFGPGLSRNKDPRVRQAISMSLDRDALMSSATTHQAARCRPQVRNDKCTTSCRGRNHWLLDPNDPQMAPARPTSSTNPTEAKNSWKPPALVRWHRSDLPTPPTATQALQRHCRSQHRFINAVRETSTEVQDYSAKYITQTFIGNFKGIAFGYETPFHGGGSYMTPVLHG